jgi:integrase
MSVSPLLIAAGRRRSPVTLPGYLAGRPPRNKGLRYPPDPPTVEEIVAVMRAAGEAAHGARMRALVVLLWRAGLRITEALTVTEHDLDARLGAILVRHGKGGRRREVGMDPWGFEHLRPWLGLRLRLPVGQLLCVIDGPTRGRSWASDTPTPSRSGGGATSGAVRVVSAPSRSGVARRPRPRRSPAPHQVRRARRGARLEIARPPRTRLTALKRERGRTRLAAACRAKEKPRQHCRGADELSRVAFSIPGIVRSTRRWQRSRD